MSHLDKAIGVSFLVALGLTLFSFYAPHSRKDQARTVSYRLLPLGAVRIENRSATDVEVNSLYPVAVSVGDCKSPWTVEWFCRGYPQDVFIRDMRPPTSFAPAVNVVTVKFSGASDSDSFSYSDSSPVPSVGSPTTAPPDMPANARGSDAAVEKPEDRPDLIERLISPHTGSTFKLRGYRYLTFRAHYPVNISGGVCEAEAVTEYVCDLGSVSDDNPPVFVFDPRDPGKGLPDNMVFESAR